jgi:hypothetical protein
MDAIRRREGSLPIQLTPKIEPPPNATIHAEKKAHDSQQHSVHIGTIEVRVAQPPAPIPLRIASARSAGLAAPLSRGFMSPVGLRQG